MKIGDFYPSTCVEIDEVSIKNNTLDIKIIKEANVDYRIQFIGCLRGQIKSQQFQEVAGDFASFAISVDMLFVRCKIISTKLHQNPVENLIYETAWTQPVHFAE